jgi:hypothetical protein
MKALVQLDSIRQVESLLTCSKQTIAPRPTRQSKRHRPYRTRVGSLISSLDPLRIGNPFMKCNPQEAKFFHARRITLGFRIYGGLYMRQCSLRETR